MNNEILLGWTEIPGDESHLISWKKEIGGKVLRVQKEYDYSSIIFTPYINGKQVANSFKILKDAMIEAEESYRDNKKNKNDY